MRGRKTDLTGKTFGDIRVIAEAGKGKNNATLWQCECLRCGSTFVAVGTSLTAKDSPRKDCGCSRREREKDLSGQTFGGIEVIRREGNAVTGAKQYLCRGLHCGKEKLLPSNVIKNNPQSCGCTRFPSERMQQLNRLGLEKIVDNGVNIHCAVRTKPNADNTSGYRWVQVKRRNGKEFIFALFFVQGKRYYKGGFASLESAYRWAEREHRIAVEMTGVKLPGEEEGNERV